MLNLPEAMFVIRCLVRETFRQALAARTFWLMLAASALCILFCLSIQVEGPRTLKPPGEIELWSPDGKPLTGPNPAPGQVTIGFGAIRLWMFRDAEGEVHFLQVLLAKWVAGAAGMLLALIWTAGFLPEFLQPSSAAVLLAKPVPRWSLLVGKYLGVLAFVAFQAVVFVGGTWLALGLRTGLWPPSYLLALPLLLLHFAIVYSFSALLAVYTRSTVACMFGSIMFWLVCSGINYARHAVVAQPTLAPESPPYPAVVQVTAEAGYWLMPKPGDLLLLLDQALGTSDHLGGIPAFAVVLKEQAFSPELSLLSSLLFSLVLLALASWQLEATDY